MIQQQWLQLKMKFAWDNSDKSRLFLGRPVHTSNSQRCHHGWCQALLIFEIITCIVKSMIATSTYFLLKFNWKKKTRKMLYWSPKRPLYVTGWLNENLFCEDENLVCVGGSLLRKFSLVGVDKPFQEIFNMHVAKCTHKYS